MIQLRKNIFFDPEKHWYFEKLKTGARTIPSVTQVLKASGAQDQFRFIRPRHAQRGSFVHKAIYLDIAGTLDEDTIDPLILGYVNAFRAWRDADQPEIVASEHPLYSQELDVCGTADLLAWVPSVSKRRRVDVIDFKTGAADKSYDYQNAGYAILMWGAGWLKHGAGCLYLKPDGTYKKYKPMPIERQMAAGAEFVRMARAYHEKKTELFMEAI